MSMNLWQVRFRAWQNKKADGRSVLRQGIAPSAGKSQTVIGAIVDDEERPFLWRFAYKTNTRSIGRYSSS